MATHALIRWLGLGLGIFSATAAMATASSPSKAVPDRDLSAIPPLYQQIAAHHAVPADIFYAVALGESRSALSDKQVRPWPWTLNVAGTGKRFNSREEAYEHLSQLLARGHRNVDVGLVQVNWRWNGDRFESAWHALDPVVNLSTGARILRELKDNCGDCSWWTVVGQYHNPTKPWLAAAYVRRVKAQWASF